VKKTLLAARAFDALAEAYDETFTRSAIGRAQRSAVRQKCLTLLSERSHILELNCGTGDDALFFAARGHQVTALDASAGMIGVAKRRKTAELPLEQVQFHQVATEDLWRITGEYQTVFSNFSGLNCVANVKKVAEDLKALTAPEACLLLCLSTRLCVWETLWYLYHGRSQKACRRWLGHTKATIDGVVLDVYYPTVNQIRRAFEPTFRLRSITGIGVFVPPTYAEAWMRRHCRLLTFLQACDRITAEWPIFRVLGDHMLLHLQRVPVGDA
jgi:ubiquinone/menaquinone biosynthesis C-methylase UbiE